MVQEQREQRSDQQNELVEVLLLLHRSTESSCATIQGRYLVATESLAKVGIPWLCSGAVGLVLKVLGTPIVLAIVFGILVLRIARLTPSFLSLSWLDLATCVFSIVFLFLL